MSKQTAVEWLIEQCPRINTIASLELIEKAKQMHKEEIVNAVDGYPLDKRHLDGKEYYEQTYGGNNE